MVVDLTVAEEADFVIFVLAEALLASLPFILAIAFKATEEEDDDEEEDEFFETCFESFPPTVAAFLGVVLGLDLFLSLLRFPSFFR